jgi:hypothetical protein
MLAQIELHAIRDVGMGIDKPRALFHQLQYICQCLRLLDSHFQSLHLLSNQVNEFL